MGKTLDDNVQGISPLGGNSIEGTGAYQAAIVDYSVQAVPLVYDARVGAYISEQAKQELDDREDDLSKAEDYRREEEFRTKIGYRRT